MKCRIIREDMELSPKAEVSPRLTVERRIRRNKRFVMARFWKLDAIHEHPHAYMLVRQGCAVPADQECADACGMTDEEMKRAQAAYERTNRGIHPDDFAKYEAGEIAGYDGNGNYIPGPNAKTFDDDEDEGGDLSDEY